MTTVDRQPPGVRVHHHLDEVRDLWRSLGDEVGHPFATWEFGELWWRHFGHGRPLRLVVSTTPDGRSAILPLYQARARPLRLLRFLGHTTGDLPGPVAAPTSSDAVRQAVRALHGGTGGRPLADLVLAEQLAGPWSALLPGRRLAREEAPVLHTRGRSWAQIMTESSKNLRQQAGRRERALRREHEVALRLTTTAAQLEEDLAVLVRLHALRWGHDGAFAGPRGEFHREFARLALERGWLRLWRLDVDGRPAAAWHGFRFAGHEWFYQAGRDPELERLRVGFVLMVHTLREAVDDGVETYQFLRGGEEYKLRFADELPVLQTVLTGLTAPGRLAAAVGDGLARLPGRQRAQLRRLLGS